MTRKQLERAAKIYSLATLAHLDGDPEDNEDAGKVMQLASKRARTKLRNMGIDMGEVVHIDDAIDLAVAGR